VGSTRRFRRCSSCTYPQLVNSVKEQRPPVSRSNLANKQANGYTSIRYSRLTNDALVPSRGSSGPQHPHLVHEIAVLADQRHRAGQALTSEPLEEWHRYSLPSFTERMRTLLRNHCQEDHQSWPASGRCTRHIAEATRRRRVDACNADVRALKSAHDQTQSPRLGFVDLDTGEIKQL
jgi:hypothetical protein